MLYNTLKKFVLRIGLEIRKTRFNEMNIFVYAFPERRKKRSYCRFIKKTFVCEQIAILFKAKFYNVVFLITTIYYCTVTYLSSNAKN